MIDHMKEKTTTDIKVDMMIEKEITFKIILHQKNMMIKNTKKGTQIHLLNHILHHIRVQYPEEVVAGITKGIMKTEEDSTPKDKTETKVKPQKEEKKEDIMKIKAGKRNDHMPGKNYQNMVVKIMSKRVRRIKQITNRNLKIEVIKLGKKKEETTEKVSIQIENSTNKKLTGIQRDSTTDLMKKSIKDKNTHKKLTSMDHQSIGQRINIEVAMKEEINLKIIGMMKNTIKESQGRATMKKKV